MSAVSRDQEYPRIRLFDIRKACSTCSLRMLCLPVSLGLEDTEALERIIERSRPLRKGDRLYSYGQSFSAIHVVYSGSLKSSTVDQNGKDQVIAFHLPGELVGLDAIGTGRHPSSIEALETTSVCKLPFARLEELARQIPGLQHQLLSIMSKEIFADHDLLHVVVRRKAEQRLAILLLSLSHRFARRGLSRTRFRLSMSRHDLGNFLGLAPETTSRVFKRFMELGWLNVSGKEIELLDLLALQSLAENRGVSLHSSRQGIER